jgi:site-specific DNA recombinase
LDKVMLSLTNFAAEMEREKARQRTYDAMLKKAKALHVTGGKVYGYENLEVFSPGAPPDGSPIRLHVVRQISEVQAGIVRRIFEMYAAGLGITRIAKALNAEHIPAPWHQRRVGGWAPTAIREILHRELYRGVIVWNKHQKVIRGGTKKRRQRPVSEWLRLDAPLLRIISDELWASVQARLTHQASAFARIQSGQLLGKPSALDGHSPYLLTGFTTCTRCSGAIGGVTQLHGTGPTSNRRRVTFYACMWHRKRGINICSNDVVVRQDLVDRVLLGAIQETLDERVIDAAVDRTLAKLRTDAAVPLDRRAEIERKLALAEQRIQRGLDALFNGTGLSEELQARLKDEKAKKTALADELDRLTRLDAVTSLDTVRLKRDLKERVRDVRALLGRHQSQARQMLRKLLIGKIEMEPIVGPSRRGYRLSGRLSYGRLLQGEAVQCLQATGTEANSRTVVSPTGTAPLRLLVPIRVRVRAA